MRLPIELLFKVLNYSDTETLYNFSNASQHFRQVALAHQKLDRENFIKKIKTDLSLCYHCPKRKTGLEFYDRDYLVCRPCQKEHYAFISKTRALKEYAITETLLRLLPSRGVRGFYRQINTYFLEEDVSAVANRKVPRTKVPQEIKDERRHNILRGIGDYPTELIEMNEHYRRHINTGSPKVQFTRDKVVEFCKDVSQRIECDNYCSISRENVERYIRKRILMKKMAEFDMEIRDDSRLCRLFIQGDAWYDNIDREALLSSSRRDRDVDLIVKRMCEVRFLFEYMNIQERMDHILRSNRNGYVRNLFDAAERSVMKGHEFPKEWPWLLENNISNLRLN